MLPEKPRTDVTSSLVVRSIVANIVTTTLTLMHALTPVRTSVRAMAGSCKPSRVVGWLCFNHPLIRCQVLTY